MKKLIISLIAISLFTMGYSQIFEREFNEVALEEVSVTSLNAYYLHTVKVKEMPPSVDKLQNKAARFDVTKSRKFKPHFEAYEVIFSQDNGKIVATYDKDGKILTSYEKFDNIPLPPAVRNKIWKHHPGWVIQKDIYLVKYYSDQGVKKTCKLKLTKEGEQKNIKIDLEDVL